MATIFTQDGEEFIVDLLDPDDAQAKLTDLYVGWGTDGTTATKSDAALGAEAAESRVATTNSQPSADVYRGVAEIVCAGSGKTIAEAGLFTASSSGVLLIHGDFTGIALGVGDSIEFTIDLEFT